MPEQDTGSAVLTSDRSWVSYRMRIDDTPTCAPGEGRGGLSPHARGLAALAGAGALAMLMVSPVDAAWTRYLADHEWAGLARFMGQTMFEGEMIGGSDFAILGLIAGLVLYFRSWRASAGSALRAWRPRLGYVFTASLICGVYFVHTVKWLMGRARPNPVWEDGIAYSDWWRFGPMFVADGVFRGSFPSGHTASVFLFMGLAYALMGRENVPRVRVAGAAVAVVAVVYAVCMAVGRAMTGSHWVSDSLGTVAVCWPLMHWLYFYVLRIPEQAGFQQRCGRPPDLPWLWELRLCFWLFLCCFFCLWGVLGLRGVFLDNAPWMGLLTPLHAVLAMWFWQRTWRTYAELTQALNR